MAESERDQKHTVIINRLKTLECERVLPAIEELLHNFYGTSELLNEPYDAFDQELAQITQALATYTGSIPLNRQLVRQISIMACWKYRFKVGDQYWNPLEGSWFEFCNQSQSRPSLFLGDDPFPPQDMIRDFLCK